MKTLYSAVILTSLFHICYFASAQTLRPSVGLKQLRNPASHARLLDCKCLAEESTACWPWQRIQISPSQRQLHGLPQTLKVTLGDEEFENSARSVYVYQGNRIYNAENSKLEAFVKPAPMMILDREFSFENTGVLVLAEAQKINGKEKVITWEMFGEKSEN